MLRLIVLVACLAIASQAACPAGKTGANCELADPCASGNPCKNGQVCHGLTADFKPNCACPHGFKGAKCAERDCPIVAYKGKAIVGNVNIHQGGSEKLAKLDKLAQACKVIVNVKDSFTRSINVDDEPEKKDMALALGKGFRFTLSDEKNKPLCDEKCLAKTPAKGSAVECFLNKVKDGHLTPGMLQAAPAADDAVVLMKVQNGCHLRTEFPMAPPSKLVGKWKLVGSENWEEFMKANNIGWFKRAILRTLKPDVHISNSGKNWVVAVFSTFKNMKSEFTEGKKWESDSPIAGDRTEHMARSEGKDKLIEDQVIFANPQRKIHIVREVNEKDQFVQTMTIKNVVTKRIYERIV